MVTSEMPESPGAVSGRLPDGALGYLQVVTVLQALLVSVGAIMLSLWLLDAPWAVRVVILVLLVAGASLLLELGILNRLRIRYTTYYVDRTCVRLHRGRMLKRNTIIPSAQLLNVTVVQGPLMARWNLAKVKFTCIAHPEPLGPLSLEEAEKIRAEALALYLEDS